MSDQTTQDVWLSNPRRSRSRSRSASIRVSRRRRRTSSTRSNPNAAPVTSRNPLSRQMRSLRNMIMPFSEVAMFGAQLVTGPGIGSGFSQTQNNGAYTSVPGVNPQNMSLQLYLNGFLGTVAQVGTATATSYNFGTATDYSNLYDEFRVDKWVLEFTWTQSNISAGTNPTLVLPQIYYTTDYNDTTPLTIQTMQQSNPELFQFAFGRKFTKTLYPRTLVPVFGTDGTFVGSETVPASKWKTTAQTNPQMMGVKLWFDNPTASTGASPVYEGHLNITSTIFFSCKNSH